jgi:large subunit ribosomal protein L25
MMAAAVIPGQQRESGGRSTNARLRRNGFIPAVVYGGKGEPECISLSKHELTTALDNRRKVISVDVEGKQTDYLIKGVERDHLGADLLHVDLMRIDPAKRVRVNVPVEYKGDPKGTKQGGLLMILRTEIQVECLMSSVPELFEHNIAELGLGKSLHARDLKFPSGVEALAPGELLVTVRAKRGTKSSEEEELETTEGEAPAEPEVIGRGKSEEEDG